MELSKKELEEEIKAVKDVIKIHEAGVKQNVLGIRANGFVLKLLENLNKRIVIK